MRNTWKIAVAFTLVLGLGGALAQAQLIAGNTAADGNPPINTWNFTTGLLAGTFIPTGATAAHRNGRGVAIGGTEIFYTELTGADGFGPTDFIRVAPFNAGAGGADGRLLVGGVTPLPNPRPGFGIRDLTFSNGNLYALTGYPLNDPIVYKLNLLTGAVFPPAGGVPIAAPASFDSDGFAVHPTTGNFLINNGDTSCIYNQYSPANGALIPGTTINVPGGPAQCTGVDTDGTSLYFVTDFDSITRTDLTGTVMNGFTTIPEDFTEDISVVHPVTIITGVDPAHLWIGLRNSDDIGTWYDLKAEMLVNGVSITSGVTRCIQGLIRDPKKAFEAVVPFGAFSSVTLVSGDVVAIRVSTRVGTNPDETFCGGHNGTVGLRLYYDYTGYTSHIDATIAPTTLPQSLFLRSDGNPCNDAGFESSGVTSRILSPVTPTASFANKKCKDALGFKFTGGNPFVEIGTLPVPAGTWSLAAQP